MGTRYMTASYVPPASTLAPRWAVQQSQSCHHDPFKMTIRFHHSLTSNFQPLPITLRIKSKVLAIVWRPYMVDPCCVRDLPSICVHHSSRRVLLDGLQTSQASIPPGSGQSAFSNSPKHTRTLISLSIALLCFSLHCIQDYITHMLTISLYTM